MERHNSEEAGLDGGQASKGRETNETKVMIVRPASRSVRTTIPSHAAYQMGLEADTVMHWEIDKEKDWWNAIIQKKQIGTGNECYEA